MILYLLYPELQLVNIKPTIKNKLKDLLNELKKFKVQTILVLEYKKRNDHKIFHSCTLLIASNSSIITKIKNYACEDWIVFRCNYKT